MDFWVSFGGASAGVSPQQGGVASSHIYETVNPPIMAKQPILGSAALRLPPATAEQVHVSPSTCQDLSLFKELMREYRKLDDGITMRLNRNAATFQDRDRTRGSTSKQDDVCAFFWKELVATWKGRTEIIDYCVHVVDQRMDETRKAIQSVESNISSDGNGEDEADAKRQRRKHQATLLGDEVKRKQIHNELTVEQIVRHRSLEAFKTRCRYFQPPLTDVEARKWWDAASAR